jgi:hypothetical protein
MDVFEKQQTIETLKTVVKARWFYAISIFLQGLVMKFFLAGVPLPNSSIIIYIISGSLLVNFCYWIYLRRPPEKIDTSVLKLIKVMQIIIDMLAIATIMFFSGTVNKEFIVTIFISLMVCSYLYQKRGIFLSAILAAFIYSSLAILEYFGWLNRYFISQTDPSINGDLSLLKLRLIGTNMYIISAVIFAVFLSVLFKNREKKLNLQRDDLFKKTEQLTIQTQELTKTKDYLHEALTKSDKARGDLEQTKLELEKANLELKSKLDEIEKYSEVTTGRELKMIELKNEIKNLQDRIKTLEEQAK